MSKKKSLNNSTRTKPHERTFERIYDFYKLNDDEAQSLIGQAVYVINRGDQLYFPVGLENKWENYGKQTGLISVSPIWPESVYNKKPYPIWFRVAAFSPDDLDIDLDFLGDETIHRENVIKFMYDMPWVNTSYREILEIVQAEFKAGKFV